MKTWQAILLLFILGVGLHFGRLGVPREVVFDEVHFGKFVTAYCCTRERFFDIHPPHGKLLIAGTARLFGYNGGFDFDHIGESYGAISPVALRLFPALTGILLPLVFYGFLRCLNVSSSISFFGGLAAALDNAMLVQTRIIALDGLLLLATFGSIALFLSPTSLKLRGVKAWGCYALSGVLAGLAAGTKFTGLAALGLLGIFHFSRFRMPDAKFWLRRGLLILVSALVIYIAGWWLHFGLLTQPGPGDVWGVPAGNFWQDTVKLHKTMLSANYNLTATHPDESSWWSWPLMLTSVFYWGGDKGAVIYFLGNPVVWWGAAGLFLIALTSAIRKKIQNPKSNIQNLWIPLVGFFLAMLPLVRVPRALFLYHYLTPLLFSLAFGLVWLDQELGKKRKKIIFSGIVLLAGGFVLFSPLTYGFHVNLAWLQALWWLPDWR